MENVNNTRHSVLWALLILVLIAGNTDVYAQESAVSSDTLSALSDAPDLPENDQCITCHLDVEEIPADFFKEDVHLKEGLSCAGCHGGDPTKDDEELAKGPGTGFIGVPSRAEIPQFCGKCHSDPAFMRTYNPRIHSDQEAQYATSVHGKRLKEGDTKVAECASCHTAHGILPASDSRSSVNALNVPQTCANCHSDGDYMEGYGLRTDEYKKYAQSVHGKALLENKDTGAPACNDCHGNHGALPPNVSSIHLVCGTCHVNNMDYFISSDMGLAWLDDGDYHACVECHSNHDIQHPTDDMVGVGDAAVCMDCHDEGEDAYVVAAAINRQLNTLVAAYDSAEVKRKEVVKVGMDDLDIQYMLKDVHQSLVHSRTLVHTFDSLKVAEKTTEGTKLAREAYQASLSQLEESWTRRVGLAITTIFITMLIVGLFFKVRDMDREHLA